LSLAVNTSLIALMRDKIFCTEPFRIPVAGAVDVCCFDKTGTLTSDDFVVKGVVGLSDDPEAVTLPKDLPDDVKITIAGCHALAHVDREVIGDPMEKAAIQALDWTFRANVAASRPKGDQRVRVVHRYPFSSALKRMSCVVSPDHEGREPALRLVAKGAAEEMQSRFTPASIPAQYEKIQKNFARQGYRVLALGWKSLGKQTKDNRILNWSTVPRQDMEKDLTFAGFLIMSCPLKRDSLASVEHLIASTHRVVMITGDHTLTACSVASTLSITTKPTLILTQSADKVSWVSVDETENFPFDANTIAKLNQQYDLCTSGQALETAQQKVSKKQFRQFIDAIRVFARTSPDQKELILFTLKEAGHIALMCGDGTNDVGALKQAHIGVALIGQESLERESPVATSTKTTKGKSAFQRRLEAMEEANEEAPLVRLGDASIASPFTSKIPSIISTINIIKQGRCTLVTTLQMFKILALNCLISAYSMSVLYLDGVKLGDTQMTAAGLAIAMFFLFISRSKPLKTLSSERPHHKLFTFNMFFTVVGQFVIHMYVLMEAVSWAKPLNPTDKETRDPDSEFKPNILNTVVFLISTSMTVATFMANYQGKPFMEGLKDNKPFLYSLIATDLTLFVGALNIFPPLNDALELYPLPEEFGNDLVALMLADLIGTTVYAYIIRNLFRIRTKLKR